MHPPSVLLDIGPAVHQRAGLARYAERLAAALLEDQADTVALALFYNAHSGHQPPATLRHTPVHTVPLGQYAWRLSVLASQLANIPYRPIERILRTSSASFTIRSSQATIYHSIYHATEHLLPHLTVPTVLTVHDLIFERYPAHHTRRNMLYLRAAMPRFVRAATAVIAVSAHTKRDLVELYGADPTKIYVIHEGIDPTFAPAAASEVARVSLRYSAGRPYVLMVGTLEPRKNHAAALTALARLKAAGFPHRLVVAGGKGWLFEPIRRQVEALGLAGDVNFAGYVPAADLPALYSGAACVLAPSLYEGFGFPVLEAMACGAPVVCSNVSSLPEVAGGAALLAPPVDDAALADAVRLVLTQPALAAALRAQGLVQARSFSWERTAAQTAEMYRTLANRSTTP